MAITKRHQEIHISGKATSINQLEEEGILHLYERQIIDRKGNIRKKYFAKIPNTDIEFEITPVAYKSMVE